MFKARKLTRRQVFEKQNLPRVQRKPWCIVYDYTPETAVYIACQLGEKKENKTLTMGYVMELYAGFFLIGKRGGPVLMKTPDRDWESKEPRWLVHELFADLPENIPKEDLHFQGIHTARLFLMYGSLCIKRFIKEGYH